MEIGLMARSAEALEHDVRAALEVNPTVDGHEIAVTVEDGVVTLSGHVASLRAAVAAERAVKNVDGVRSIANSLHVRARNERTDTDIAREALHRLRNNVAVPLYGAGRRARRPHPPRRRRHLGAPARRRRSRGPLPLRREERHATRS